jgi:hypothetical protein
MTGGPLGRGPALEGGQQPDRTRHDGRGTEPGSARRRSIDAP